MHPNSSNLEIMKNYQKYNHEIIIFFTCVIGKFFSLLVLFLTQYEHLRRKNPSMLLVSKFSRQKSGFALLRRHDTFNHHFDLKMQRARTNNIARERAITEKTVTSFRSIKVRLIESRDFSKTQRGKRERSETRR